MRYLLLIVFLFSKITIFSQINTDSGIKADTSLVTNGKNNNDKHIEDTSISELYKSLYETSLRTGDRLTSLLITAFSVLVAVILAIVGSTVFYNYRFNKKEFELLNKESKGNLEEAQNFLIEKTRGEIDKLIEKTNNEVDKRFLQINENYKSNLDTIKDSLKAIVESFKNDIDKQLLRIVEEVKVIKQDLENQNKVFEVSLTRNEKYLTKEIYNLKGDMYSIKEWYSLALSSYVDQALLCVELKAEWQLEYIANDIIRSIEGAIKKNETITPHLKNNIEKLLPNFSFNLSDKKIKIEELYKKLIIKEVELPKRNIDLGFLLNLWNTKTD